MEKRGINVSGFAHVMASPDANWKGNTPPNVLNIVCMQSPALTIYETTI